MSVVKNNNWSYMIEGLKAEGHTPIYKMHKYFARRPQNVFSALVKNYSEAGDIILDPFGGGGVTMVEGSALNRHVVSNDINPLAAFITKCEATKVGVDDYLLPMLEILSEVRSFAEPFYLTHNRDTGEQLPVPKRVIELKSMIHGQRPSITPKEEADALFPFFPQSERIVIDVCDIEDLETAKSFIDSKVKRYIVNDEGSELYAAFIMALIPLGCHLGYSIGNKVQVQTYQHFRDSEDWKWRDGGGSFTVAYANITEPSENVNLLINISGTIDRTLITTDYPEYSINANSPGFSFLQSWQQVLDFRQKYRNVLDKIRQEHGESVTIHLYPATPNPINFEIGKGIMKNLDPTIILYDKTSGGTVYREVMCLHKRIRE